MLAAIDLMAAASVDSAITRSFGTFMDCSSQRDAVTPTSAVASNFTTKVSAPLVRKYTPVRPSSEAQRAVSPPKNALSNLGAGVCAVTAAQFGLRGKPAEAPPEGARS